MTVFGKSAQKTTTNFMAALPEIGGTLTMLADTKGKKEDSTE